MKQIECNLILDNWDQSRNILETIRARENNGDKSQEIKISEFGMGKILRESRLLWKRQKNKTTYLSVGCYT